MWLEIHFNLKFTRNLRIKTTNRYLYLLISHSNTNIININILSNFLAIISSQSIFLFALQFIY